MNPTCFLLILLFCAPVFAAVQDFEVDDTRVYPPPTAVGQALFGCVPCTVELPFVNTHTICSVSSFCVESAAFNVYISHRFLW